MSLENWRNNGWLVDHQPTRDEIEGLIGVVDRDLKDAATQSLSFDWRLAIAYNAALQCAVAALAASGFRVGRGGSHHYYAIESLEHTIGAEVHVCRTLNAFRKKRNVADYERAGAATRTEVEEISALAAWLREQLLDWLRDYHPNLVPGG